MSVATVAALSVTTAGHAHEGPATDALAKYDVFLPLEAAPAQAVRRRLETVVRRAQMAGYPLKVAIIGAPVDLGEVYRFWGKPQAYARFLGGLLALTFKGSVLVVMPSGFGLSGGGKTIGNKRAVLRRIHIARGVDGLVDSATAAAAAVAAADGHAVSVPPAVHIAAAKPNGNHLRDRLIIGAAGSIFVFSILLGSALSRRRHRVPRARRAR